MVKTTQYSIIVPVFNSEKSLKELCIRIEKVFNLLKQEFEIILVDDNSKDNSWAVIRELSKINSNVKGIQLMDNFGQHNATFCGFSFASGKFIITLDDDLQHPPEEIPKLINKMHEGYDVVYGTWKEHEVNIFRIILSHFRRSITSKYTHNHSNYAVTSFRLLKNTITKKILKINSKFIHLGTFINWHTSNIAFVEVQHNSRLYGRSNYTLGKMIGFSLNILLKLTDIPLKISIFIGVVFSLAALLTGFHYVLLYILHEITIPGYASIIIAISFFSGIQLISTGINSMYLGKIYMTLLNKPRYSIRNTIGFKSKIKI